MKSCGQHVVSQTKQAYCTKIGKVWSRIKFPINTLKSVVFERMAAPWTPRPHGTPASARATLNSGERKHLPHTVHLELSVAGKRDPSHATRATCKQPLLPLLRYHCTSKVARALDGALWSPAVVSAVSCTECPPLLSWSNLTQKTSQMWKTTIWCHFHPQGWKSFEMRQTASFKGYNRSSASTAAAN